MNDPSAPAKDKQAAQNETERVQLLHWLVDLWLDYWPTLLTTVGTIFIAIGGIQLGKSPTGSFVVGSQSFDLKKCYWTLFIVSGILFLIGQITVHRRTGIIKEKDRKIAELIEDAGASDQQTEELSKTLLDIFREFITFLGVDVLELGPDERISLYKHFGNAFQILGRYSENPRYAKTGRSIYPDNQGCIGQAWLRGRAEVVLPDPLSVEEEYLDELIRIHGYSDEEARNLTMPSQHYIGFAIRNTKRENVGVLIVESTRNGYLDVEEVRTRLVHTWHLLMMLVSEVNIRGYDLSYSIEEGL